MVENEGLSFAAFENLIQSFLEGSVRKIQRTYVTWRGREVYEVQVLAMGESVLLNARTAPRHVDVGQHVTTHEGVALYVFERGGQLHSLYATEA